MPHQSEQQNLARWCAWIAKAWRGVGWDAFTHALLCGTCQWAGVTVKSCQQRCVHFFGGVKRINKDKTTLEAGRTGLSQDTGTPRMGA